jgi:putative aldouronate transport system permease protein
MLSEIFFNKFKRITQSLIILPNFISWAIVAMFAVPLFSTDGGIINGILQALGLETMNFYTDSGIWPGLLTFIRLWKGAGFGSIVILAVITGIDQELYEAARIDGASRLKCILHITLPHVKTIVIIQTIMAVGGMFYGDFGMIFAMVGDNPLLYPSTDVIDTFVYRTLRRSPNLGIPSAVGLYQSVIGFIMVIAANYITKKFEPDSAIF